VTRRSTESARYLSPFLAIVLLAACTAQPSSRSLASAAGSGSMQTDQARQDQIARGRFVVISHDCGGCHGGGSNPASTRWLDGMRDTINDVFHIGPFITRPKNLTPDNATGTGRFSERQIFNALRYGLRPEETPDVEITSTVPGQGNFPLHPHYLAPPMPWDAWRHMPDQDLWAIAAYLKQGVKPSNHRVPDSDGPPDFWASVYTVQNIGAYPAVPYPTASEKR
jgi:mono/diheme cytochrome c family protein